MSDIEFSTVKAPSYPKGKVIGIYGLLGGAIGSLIVFVPVIIIDAVTGASLDPIEIGKILASVSIIGAVVGLLPSLVAGIIICKFTLCFDSARKILPLFAIGLFSTFIFSVWIMLDEIVSEKIISALLFSLIGGASAVVTGLIALPKYK